MAAEVQFHRSGHGRRSRGVNNHVSIENLGALHLISERLSHVCMCLNYVDAGNGHLDVHLRRGRLCVGNLPTIKALSHEDAWRDHIVIVEAELELPPEIRTLT